MRKLDGLPLWIGTARDARDIKTVLDAEIKVIIDLALMCEPVKPTRELVYLRFPMLDGEGNPPWLLRAAVNVVQDMISLWVPTLIACDGGMSRSPLIASAAISSRFEVSLADALRQVTDGVPADVHPALWNDVKQFAAGVML